MKAEDTNTLRHQIKLILSSGVGTEAFPRPDTHDDFQNIIRRLQEHRRDLEAKVIIGGFTVSKITHNDQVQCCRSCIYYLHHRRHCALPELDVPVEPDWSCRLWRI